MLDVIRSTLRLSLSSLVKVISFSVRQGEPQFSGSHDDRHRPISENAGPATYDESAITGRSARRSTNISVLRTVYTPRPSHLFPVAPVILVFFVLEGLRPLSRKGGRDRRRVRERVATIARYAPGFDAI